MDAIASPQTTRVAWSSGKDSMLCLYRTLKSSAHRVQGLFTTGSEEYHRVSLHGVRLSLVEEQARSLGLPLDCVLLSASRSHEEYFAKLDEHLCRYRQQRVSTIAYGDIYLEALREEREVSLKKADLTGFYPLWKQPPLDLIEEFLSLGFKAVIVCVDTHVLPSSFLGRTLDHALLAELPAGVDPCGENGEFHTFVYDGPLFKQPVAFERGTLSQHGNFGYVDLVSPSASLNRTASPAGDAGAAVV